MTIRLEIHRETEAAATTALSQLCADRFASRLLDGDSSLWGTAAAAEAERRLGWVDPFAASSDIWVAAEQLREHLRAQQIDRVVLCGMGGSSLGPALLAHYHGAAIQLLDSTHPAEVRRAVAGDLTRTVVIISSKSGTTLETVSLERIFTHAYRTAGISPQRHLVYITDPGSPFAARTREGYRVFLADPNVGGRFSVLTAFGIVPAVLAGATLQRTFAEADAARSLLFSDSPANPALRLAATLAAALPNKFALLLRESSAASSETQPLSDWIEQLIAESTGKAGTGILPIPLAANAPELRQQPPNALLARLTYPRTGTIRTAPATAYDVEVHAPLGAQILLWQVTTAALGRLLGINPFDQPNVEAAKAAAQSVMRSAQHPTQAAVSPSGPWPAAMPIPPAGTRLRLLREVVPTAGYLTVQAFVDRSSPAAATARNLRDHLARNLGVPVSLGWAPRYLHSTGQLHKGGPPIGTFVQLIDASARELHLPGVHPGFRELLLAQAQGDFEVLTSLGRPVFVWTV